MSNILCLGKLINHQDFSYYIDEAEKFEDVTHIYGEEFNIPDYPCWMTYSLEEGSISFTRNTRKNNLLSEMVNIVVNNLEKIFPENLKPNPDRVHILRTIGSIRPHRDEAGRMTCINIGLKNSSSAITRVSTGNNFQVDYRDYIIEDGVGYLLNTNELHSVIGSDTPRYLITYGFATNFNQLKDNFKVIL